jgi:hypothetical protein
VYWLGGPINALVAGVALVLPAVLFLTTQHLAELHRHDVIMQEAIRFAEARAALSRAEATRRLHLPAVFSRREERTGEPDEPIEALA